jgi:hypothetical protein
VTERPLLTLSLGAKITRIEQQQGVANRESVGFTAEEQQRVFHDNAAQLLGL